jgi:D-amino-acid dehydrogenase
MGPDSPLYIRPHLDLDQLGWLWSFWRHCNARDFQRGLRATAEFARGTMPGFDALAADGIDMEMERSGVLFLFASEAGARHVRDELELMEPYGYTGRYLGPDALRAVEPSVSDDVTGGILVEGERHLRPERLITELVRRLAELGVDIRREEIRDPTAIRADTVVLAAGAWSSKLARAAGFRLPVIAGRGYGITVEAPTLRLRWPTYLVEGRVACTPLRGALRVAGTMEIAPIGTAARQVRFDAVGRTADRYLAGWRDGGAHEQWSAPRPMTPDSLPVIGRAPNSDRLLVATGHGMLGVTLAPVTAKAIADIVCGDRPSVDLAPFDPARFN